MGRTKKRSGRKRKDPKAWVKKEQEHRRLNKVFERLHKQEGGSQVDEDQRGNGSSNTDGANVSTKGE